VRGSPDPRDLDARIFTRGGDRFASAKKMRKKVGVLLKMSFFLFFSKKNMDEEGIGETLRDGLRPYNSLWVNKNWHT
jgi:hypothetical protein